MLFGLLFVGGTTFALLLSAAATWRWRWRGTLLGMGIVLALAAAVTLGTLIMGILEHHWPLTAHDRGAVSYDVMGSVVLGLCWALFVVCGAVTAFGVRAFIDITGGPAPLSPKALSR
jgi:hypothetical protein